jgi:hypothetical protein
LKYFYKNIRKVFLAQKATLSFNITNKMNTHFIQHYQNPKFGLTIEQARERIDELTTALQGNESFHRRHSPSTPLSSQQRDNILLEEEVLAEIEFYEEQISSNEDYEAEVASYHFNDCCDREPYLAETDNDESRIGSLENKMDSVQATVYQLLGGLFNQTTQGQIMDNHIKMLYPENRQRIVDEECEESGWPTTRQGDQNESEIEILKQQVAKLEGTVDTLVQMVQSLLTQRSRNNGECGKEEHYDYSGYPGGCHPTSDSDDEQPSQMELNYTTHYGPSVKWEKSENCDSVAMDISVEDKDESEEEFDNKWGYTEGACYASAYSDDEFCIGENDEEEY